MESLLPVPNQTISKEAVKVWRLEEIIANTIILIVLGVLYFCTVYFSWKEWIGWIIIGLAVLDVLFFIWGIFIEPKLKQKYWRYEVSEEFIQLKSGVWIERHQTIPMTKVQSVELKQGPLLRKYQLYNISVGTMADKHEIPAIPKNMAYQLRDQIAILAKIKEVE